MSNKDITLEYIHLCDHASIGMGGKVNLIGIFDNFLGTITPNFFVVAKVNVKIKGVYKISFEIRAEDNEVVFTDPQPFTGSTDAIGLEFRVLKTFQNINLKKTGKYKFIILVNDLPIGYKEFKVEEPVNATNS